MSLYKFIILIALPAFVSCKKELVDRVKFKKTTQHYDLVIEGGINTFKKEQFIRLSQPSYQVTDNVSPVNDAEVFINNIKFTPAAPGIYTGLLPENKNYGELYHLKVVYKGSTYIAEDTLKKVSPLTLADLNFTSQQQNPDVLLSVPKHTFGSANPGKLFFRFPGKVDWDPSRLDTAQAYSYVHVFAPPNGLYPILEERTSVMVNPGDSITVYKFSVSYPYERYLYNVFKETDWKSIFATTPGSIKGNISGNALGYFYCTDVTVQKFAVKDMVK